MRALGTVPLFTLTESHIRNLRAKVLLPHARQIVDLVEEETEVGASAGSAVQLPGACARARIVHEDGAFVLHHDGDIQLNGAPAPRPAPLPRDAVLTVPGAGSVWFYDDRPDPALDATRRRKSGKWKRKRNGWRTAPPRPSNSP